MRAVRSSVEAAAVFSSPGSPLRVNTETSGLTDTSQTLNFTTALGLQPKNRREEEASLLTSAEFTF